MVKKIAINGFGRIGRLLYRHLHNRSDIEVVAVNDMSDIRNVVYLLKYDTVYGRFDADVVVGREGDQDYFEVGGKRVLVYQQPDPRQLPWRELGIDVVVEATGHFSDFSKARVHVEAGAKKVVITAPAKDAECDDAKTVLIGINEHEFTTCSITSNGSCTTNATHPLVAIMNETIGIEKALLTTVHAYTATQSPVDSLTRGSDLRKGRAAASNIIPSSTGASVSVTRAIPDLEGRFDGIALRVPVITGSLVDFTFVSKRPTTVEEVNTLFKKASQEDRWKDILAVTDEQIVSSDVIGQSYGALVDMSFTRVVDGTLVKILSWYDNEAGYVQTLIKHIEGALKTKNLV